MSLIVSQEPVNRLPSELVNNAAFVKQVDHDPVNQPAGPDPSAEPGARVVAPQVDTISISAEALANAKNLDPLFAQQNSSAANSTEPAPVEHQKQDDAMSRAIKSWKAMVEHLKQANENSSASSYGETRKLFTASYTDWQTRLQKSDPEAYSAWFSMLNGNK